MNMPLILLTKTSGIFVVLHSMNLLTYLVLTEYAFKRLERTDTDVNVSYYASCHRTCRQS